MRRRLAALALILAAPAALAAPPERVVSVNLCTDQIALLLAAPGQLVSVSHWASAPAASNLPEAAAALPANHGTAEEVFLLAPDLVLAGEFTNPATLAMLERLGLRTETLPIARRLEDIPRTIRRVGALLGREAAAERLVDGFEAALAAEAARAEGLPPDAAAYHYANGWTSGDGTLADAVLAAAGLENAATALGVAGSAHLPLEVLVMARPFLVRTAPIGGEAPGRAYETGRHPALARLAESGRAARIADRWQVCGTPFVTEAVRALVDARRALPGG